METREARNLFISIPPPPSLSLYLFCRARCRPECRLVVCKFFGMSARACNNFMEISSPAKHSHRVSRASNATRIEKHGKREEKKSPPCLLLYSPGRWYLSRYVDIEKGTTFMCLSRFHPRFARTNFFCFLSPSFFHPPSRRYTVCINDTPECNSRR